MSSTAPRRGHAGGGDRRIRKTQQAIREAFIALVLEGGFDTVTVEDIASRADIARATFYKHFAHKEAVLSELFVELTSELAERVTAVEGAPPTIRLSPVKELYEHAEAYRDLYRVCLRGAGDGKARAAYLQVVADAAERVFSERIKATGVEARVPLPLLGRAFAGAHAAPGGVAGRRPSTRPPTRLP